MTASVQRKIVAIEPLAQTLRELRASGRTVVQCHGCFDIVHPGHVRYLQSARQLGDVLVVSLTGDAGVSKGLDRPYIPQELRAENLAALEFVDWVVIDPRPTAAELLETLQPNVYVKGREYAGSCDPRFVREQQVVESYGGRVVFHSGDVVFSSTRLIQSLEGEAYLDECRLRTLCQRGGFDATTCGRTLDAFAGRRVVVVGDVVRERYVLCDARDVAEEAPVMALQRIGTRDFWGGAAALAIQLKALGADPVLISAIGEDAASRGLRAALEEQGIASELLAVRPTLVERTTFVADENKLFKVTDGATCPLDSVWQKRAIAAIDERLPGDGVLIWTDHGYGMISPGLVREGARLARARIAMIAAHAAGPRGEISGLVDTDLVTLTERQARAAEHDMTSGLPAVVWKLLTQTHGRTAIAGLHKRGLISFDGRSETSDDAPSSRISLPQRLKSEFVPSFATHHADLLGSEEAILAIAALTLASGGGLSLAAYLASAGDALAVGRPGRTRVRIEELRAWIESRPELRADSRFTPESEGRSYSPPPRTRRDPNGDGKPTAANAHAEAAR